MLDHLATLLAEREAQLRRKLQAEAAGALASEATRGMDFKDLAQQESEAAVADVVADHVGHELARVHAARRRIADGTYGICAECEEPIDERRLAALPSAALCTDCQAHAERTGA